MIKSMAKQIFASVALCGALFGAVAHASGSSAHFVYEMPPLSLKDEGSLQRGAKYFMNYCSGCHGLRYLRYGQMAKGVGLVDDQGQIAEAIVKKNLLFTSDKVGDLMQSAMTTEQAKAWFGTKVPDLTLVTKSRSPEWVYNYLLSFYPDPMRPLGTNNTVFPDVAMPNVFTALQGVQMPVYKTTGYDADNRPIEVVEGFRLVQAGELSPEQFQQAMYDLTNFLSFAADPKKLARERLGGMVIFFLIIFTVLAFLLKREYWKDVKDKNHGPEMR